MIGPQPGGGRTVLALAGLLAGAYVVADGVTSADLMEATLSAADAIPGVDVEGYTPPADAVPIEELILTAPDIETPDAVIEAANAGVSIGIDKWFVLAVIVLVTQAKAISIFLVKTVTFLDEAARHLFWRTNPDVDGGATRRREDPGDDEWPS